MARQAWTAMGMAMFLCVCVACGSSDGSSQGQSGASAIATEESADVATMGTMECASAAMAGPQGAVVVKALEAIKAIEVGKNVSVATRFVADLAAAKSNQSFTVTSDEGGSCTVQMSDAQNGFSFSMTCTDFKQTITYEQQTYAVTVTGTLTFTLTGSENSGVLNITTAGWTTTINGTAYSADMDVDITFSMPDDDTMNVAFTGTVGSATVDETCTATDVQTTPVVSCTSNG